MSQNNKDIISESIIEVFEKVAFLFPMPIEKEMQNEIEMNNVDNTSIGIKFQGPVSGNIFVCLPNSLTLEIAANMLGIEENDDGVEQKSVDATKEILNIICGNVLPKIYGEEPVFQLSAPYAVDDIDKEVPVNNGYEAETVNLDIESNIVKFVFAVKH